MADKYEKNICNAFFAHNGGVFAPFGSVALKKRGGDKSCSRAGGLSVLCVRRSE